jgi:hypothetical protein
VDVWLPNSKTDSAPTINDPNATVTVRIAPSNDSEKCSTWHYHYGEPPPQPNDKNKEFRSTPKSNVTPARTAGAS